MADPDGFVVAPALPFAFPHGSVTAGPKGFLVGRDGSGEAVAARVASSGRVLDRPEIVFVHRRQ